jgi:hypothetical protein
VIAVPRVCGFAAQMKMQARKGDIGVGEKLSILSMLG